MHKIQSALIIILICLCATNAMNNQRSTSTLRKSMRGKGPGTAQPKGPNPSKRRESVSSNRRSSSTQPNSTVCSIPTSSPPSKAIDDAQLSAAFVSAFDHVKDPVDGVANVEMSINMKEFTVKDCIKAGVEHFAVNDVQKFVERRDQLRLSVSDEQAGNLYGLHLLAQVARIGCEQVEKNLNALPAIKDANVEKNCKHLQEHGKKAQATLNKIIANENLPETLFADIKLTPKDFLELGRLEIESEISSHGEEANYISQSESSPTKISPSPEKAYKRPSVRSKRS